MTVPDRVVILNDFSSGEGGSSYLATTLADEIAGRGVPVTFISGDTPSRVFATGVQLVSIGGHALLEGSAGRAAIRGLNDRSAATKIAQWIERNDTPRTVYHLHNWSNIFSPSVFDALAPVAMRCAIHAHDFFLACPNGTYLDFRRREVCDRTPLSMSCLATNCDKRNYAHKLWRAARQGIVAHKLRPLLHEATFVAIHKAMVPWLERAIRPAHMAIIRNPVSPFGMPVSAPHAQRRFVHIGQVQKLKGVYDIAEAGRRLGLRIDFFGGGEDLDQLRELHPEHVYHGWTDRRAIGWALQEARAVLVGTKSPEPFCLAAFEAVAMGVPIVVSDAILAADDLAQTGAAKTFPAGDIEALTDIMGRLRDDDALVARLARAACDNKGRLGHDLSDWVETHQRLYAQLAEPAEGHAGDRVARIAS